MNTVNFNNFMMQLLGNVNNVQQAVQTNEEEGLFDEGTLNKNDTQAELGNVNIAQTQQNTAFFSMIGMLFVNLLSSFISQAQNLKTADANKTESLKEADYYKDPELEKQLNAEKKLNDKDPELEKQLNDKQAAQLLTAKPERKINAEMDPKLNNARNATPDEFISKTANFYASGASYCMTPLEDWKGNIVAFRGIQSILLNTRESSRTQEEKDIVVAYNKLSKDDQAALRAGALYIYHPETKTFSKPDNFQVAAYVKAEQENIPMHLYEYSKSTSMYENF